MKTKKNNNKGNARNSHQFPAGLYILYKLLLIVGNCNLIKVVICRGIRIRKKTSSLNFLFRFTF